MNELANPEAGKPRRRALRTTAVLLALATACAVPMASSPASGSTGWNLVASDDFNADELDDSKWGVYEGKGNGGNGWRSADAISVENGNLRITARGDVSGGLGLYGGRTYGRYEVRAKVDKGAGYGSAILLWPSSENWPEDGEIDISEVPNGDREMSGSYVHWGSDNKVIHHENYTDHSRWHTYAVDWEPHKLTFYVDGEVIWTVTEPAAIPHSKHFLALQFDVGDGGFIDSRNSSTPSEVTMHVDFVKVYQR